jgi:hypothetical protein
VVSDLSLVTLLFQHTSNGLTNCRGSFLYADPDVLGMCRVCRCSRCFHDLCASVAMMHE